MLRRRRSSEVLEAPLLEKGRLRGSMLGTLWHIRDALGRGIITRRVSTVGAVLRLASSA